MQNMKIVRNVQCLMTAAELACGLQHSHNGVTMKKYIEKTVQRSYSYKIHSILTANTVDGIMYKHFNY